jgi:hypothetical protein
MQLIVPCALFLVVGFLLVPGCVTSTKTAHDPVIVSPSPTFTRFTVPGTEGQLKISVGGLTGEYPAFIDNISVGVVSSRSPLSMTLPEGNYTVKVCCGRICKQEKVAVTFGKQRTVDVSEQLKKDLGSSAPAVRIVGYFPNTNQITIDVEFINPTPQPRTMTADVICGYSYIESRSYSRIGSVAQGHLSRTVNACDRTTESLNFDLASGFGYLYEIPTITLVSSR